MQLISKFNKGFTFLLWVINIFSKYPWFVLLKDKKGVKKKIIRKQKKVRVDKDNEFYNNSFRKWLQDNDIVVYSTYNEGKSVVAAARFIRTLKNKIYKYMTSISKNVYIDKLNDIVNE